MGKEKRKRGLVKKEGNEWHGISLRAQHEAKKGDTSKEKQGKKREMHCLTTRCQNFINESGKKKNLGNPGQDELEETRKKSWRRFSDKDATR